ncbi:hypothetical protein [Desulfuribacillus stibiiarsenatis]|nr:hypothetical protein [Desulfuribacillus stibiiarsenatis]
MTLSQTALDELAGIRAYPPDVKESPPMIKNTILVTRVVFFAINQKSS